MKNNLRDDSSIVSTTQEISPMITKLQVLIQNCLLYLVNRAELTTLRFINSTQCLSVCFIKFSVRTKIRDRNQVYRYWDQFRLLICWNLNIRKFQIFWLFTERAHKTYNKSKNNFPLLWSSCQPEPTAAQTCNLNNYHKIHLLCVSWGFLHSASPRRITSGARNFNDRYTPTRKLKSHNEWLATQTALL
jgi:hypothetical protein